jgi:hypothetical protein
MYFKAPSVEELAARAALDPGNLKRTVQDYNAAVRTKKDAFGRTFLPAEIAQPPFYAMEVSGWNLVGFGGLATNADAQLLRANGRGGWVSRALRRFGRGRQRSDGFFNPRPTCRAARHQADLVSNAVLISLWEL